MLRIVLMLSLLCAPLTARWAAAQEQVGVAAAVEGEAEVLHAGTSTWSPLVEGAPVLLKDQLRTKADGKIRVELRGDSVLQVAPGTQLEVTEQMLAPTGASRFQLLYGTLRALVVERYSELHGRFEVETPTAIAGVRGTSFIARYDPAAEETLVVGIERVTRVRASTDAPGRGRSRGGPRHGDTRSPGQPAAGAEAGSRGRAAHAAGLDQCRAWRRRRVVVAPARERDGCASPAARRRTRHLATGAGRRSAAGHAATPEAAAPAAAHPAQGR